jgi:hypothetical protein
MVYGTPVDLGRCVKRVISNVTSAGHLLSSDSDKLVKPQRILLFIASDNHGSAMQMNDTVAWADSIVSPHGCHVEMDTSIECSELTLGNW